VLLDDHIAETDPDSKSNALVLRDVGIAVGHPPLQFSGAAHGVHDTGKFGQEAVARVLYGAAAVLPDLRFNELAEMRFEAFVRALFVRSH